MPESTKVLLYDPGTVTDLSEKDFKCTVHGRDPAFILIYRLPWKEFIETSTSLDHAAKSVCGPCKFGLLNLEKCPNVVTRYNLTQSNRIMLFRGGKIYCLPMQDLSITAFETFLQCGYKHAAPVSMPIQINADILINVCADFVGIWCDHLGTFIVVMAFIGIVIVAMFILLTSNKKTERIAG